MKSCPSCFCPIEPGHRSYKLPGGVSNNVCESCYEKLQEEDSGPPLCVLCNDSIAQTHVHAYPVCQECRLAYEAVQYEASQGRSSPALHALELAQQRFDDDRAERYKSAETLVGYALEAWEKKEELR
jgi:hypothetical protein